MSDVAYFDSALPGAKQAAVKQRYLDMGRSDSPLVTLPGAIEELGEVATALMQVNPLYVGRRDKIYGELRHELIDTIIYLCAIANSQGIDLGI